MPQGILLGPDANPLGDLHWQAKAWRFYGAPDDAQNIVSVRSNEGAIGEARFALGWVAQQVGRVGWFVDIDGERLEQEDAEQLISQVATRAATVQIATNLLVAGELYYMAFSVEDLRAASLRVDTTRDTGSIAGPDLPGTEDRVWVPVSVVNPKRWDLFKTSALQIHGLWPHPASLTQPDPPLRGVLDVLAEIEQLQDVAHAQNNSRIAQMGILQIASEFDFVKPDQGSNFHTTLEQSINSPIRDPRQTGAAPILLRGPGELIQNGGGVAWAQPPRPFDDRLDERMIAAIKRLMWGLPLPPEVIEGMRSVARATAFQIEESGYTAHVEPVAALVGAVYASALALTLDGERKVRVTPDPTDLLARRHSITDIQWAYDRGLVSGEWFRDVAQIPEEAAATPEDIERIMLLKSVTVTEGSSPDPAVSAEDEAVRAAGAITARGVDLEAVSAELVAIDTDLRAELAGATSMAARRAIERVGAKTRSAFPGRGRAELDGVDNTQIPSHLGPDRLNELAVNVPAIVTESIRVSLADWWDARLVQAGAAVADILSTVGAQYPSDTDRAINRERSVDQLVTNLAGWVTDRIDRWPLPEIDTRMLAAVVATAGGAPGA